MRKVTPTKNQKDGPTTRATNNIYTGFLTVDQFPVLSCQSLNKQCAGQRTESLSIQLSQRFFVSCDKLKGLVQNIKCTQPNNPFNLSQRTKNLWLSRMDEDLTTRNSSSLPSHCIHWSLTTQDRIPAYYRMFQLKLTLSMAKNVQIKIPKRKYHAGKIMLAPKFLASYVLVHI